MPAYHPLRRLGKSAEDRALHQAGTAETQNVPPAGSPAAYMPYIGFLSKSLTWPVSGSMLMPRTAKLRPQSTMSSTPVKRRPQVCELSEPDRSALLPSFRMVYRGEPACIEILPTHAVGAYRTIDRLKHRIDQACVRALGTGL